MSIQTDLTRIKNAKAAIKAAIEGKGVTVPDATLLDGMAALIESIEAGGGGDVFISTFTPATNVTSYTVANPIGGTTLGILAIANDFGTILGTSKGIAIVYGNRNIGNGRRGYMCELNGSFKVSIPYTSAGGDVIESITNNTIELKGGHYNSVFVAGVTYTCVIAKDGVMI